MTSPAIINTLTTQNVAQNWHKFHCLNIENKRFHKKN